MNHSGSKTLIVAIVVGAGLVLGNGFLDARKQAKQVAAESRCELAYLWVVDTLHEIPVEERRAPHHS